MKTASNQLAVAPGHPFFVWMFGLATAILGVAFLVCAIQSGEYGSDEHTYKLAGFVYELPIPQRDAIMRADEETSEFWNMTALAMMAGTGLFGIITLLLWHSRSSERRWKKDATIHGFEVVQ